MTRTPGPGVSGHVTSGSAPESARCHKRDSAQASADQRRPGRVRHDRPSGAATRPIAADEGVHSDETVACGIPGLDQRGQEVRATTLQADVEPLVWEWSDRCGFATNFAYRADR